MASEKGVLHRAFYAGSIANKNDTPSVFAHGRDIRVVLIIANARTIDPNNALPCRPKGNARSSGCFNGDR